MGVVGFRAFTKAEKEVEVLPHIAYQENNRLHILARFYM